MFHSCLSTKSNADQTRRAHIVHLETRHSESPKWKSFIFAYTTAGRHTAACAMWLLYDIQHTYIVQPPPHAQPEYVIGCCRRVGTDSGADPNDMQLMPHY